MKSEDVMEIRGALGLTWNGMLGFNDTFGIAARIR